MLTKKKFPSRNGVGKIWGWSRGGQKGMPSSPFMLNKSFRGILIRVLDGMILLSCNPYRFIYEIHIILVSDLGFFFLKMSSRCAGGTICWPVISVSLRGMLPRSHLHAVSFSRCIGGVCVKLPAAVK